VGEEQQLVLSDAQLASISAIQFEAMTTTQFQVFSKRPSAFTDSQLNGLRQDQIDALYQ
jgi:hypothetical protein